MNLYDKDPRAYKLAFNTLTTCMLGEYWYPMRRESDELCIHILDQVYPLLVTTGFFEKTKFDRLSVIFRMVYPWEVNHEIKLSNDDDEFEVSISFHPEEFEERMRSDYFIFAISNIVIALESVCKKFGLDNTAVTSFVDKFETTYRQPMYNIISAGDSSTDSR
ncbi:MAG: hypothetical protein K2X81_25130 [Candidatus Obscuribacterales bacterium]|nr:hypothetical protein [Candidatus Obscuribacterales bacterium]